MRTASTGRRSNRGSARWPARWPWATSPCSCRSASVWVGCFARDAALLVGELERERFNMTTYPGATSRSWMALCHAQVGEFELGIGPGLEAIRIAEEVKDAWSI